MVCTDAEWQHFREKPEGAYNVLRGTMKFTFLGPDLIYVDPCGLFISDSGGYNHGSIMPIMEVPIKGIKSEEEMFLTEPLSLIHI